jgi:hypothetical protein
MQLFNNQLQPVEFCPPENTIAEEILMRSRIWVERSALHLDVPEYLWADMETLMRSIYPEKLGVQRVHFYCDSVFRFRLDIANWVEAVYP